MIYLIYKNNTITIWNVDVDVDVDIDIGSSAAYFGGYSNLSANTLVLIHSDLI